jgi:hypothetical protein
MYARASVYSRCRQSFYAVYQSRLYSNQTDRSRLTELVASLKRTQQQLQQGRVVLQHLQRLLMAVASDDCGPTVVQQLLLPAIRQKIEAAAAAHAAAAAAAAARLKSAREAVEQLRKVWQEPGNAAAMQGQILAQQKHAASLTATCELLRTFLDAAKQFEEDQKDEFGVMGYELVAKLAGWLTLQNAKVAAGLLLLLEQQAGETAAGGSSSSIGGDSGTGSSRKISSNNSSSRDFSSAERSAAEVDVLVANAWALSIEVLSTQLGWVREACCNVPVNELCDHGEMTILSLPADHFMLCMQASLPDHWNIVTRVIMVVMVVVRMSPHEPLIGNR